MQARRADRLTACAAECEEREALQKDLSLRDCVAINQSSQNAVLNATSKVKRRISLGYEKPVEP